MLRAAALLCLAALSAGESHPADGPDVDLRVLVTSRRVTVSFQCNLAYVDETVKTPREDETSVHPVEHEALKLDLRDHLRRVLSVELDGVRVDPVLREFEVGEPDLSKLVLFPNMGKKALTFVRLVLDYPALGRPARMDLEWASYPPDLAAVPDRTLAPPMTVVAQLTARGDVQRVEFTEDHPGHTWHDTGEPVEARFLAVPEPYEPPVWRLPLLALSLGLGGAVLLGTAAVRRRGPVVLVAPALGLLLAAWWVRDGWIVEVPDPTAPGVRLPTAGEAEAVFRPLHANIYRAFDFVEEEAIYDALARSVHGDLLDELYNDVYRGLVMQEEGGAVSRVQEVRPLEVEVEGIGLLPPAERPGFHVRARWQVDGAVFHWGHSHFRTHEYVARYAVTRTPSGWRIRDHQPLEQRRLRAWQGGGTPEGGR